MISATVAVWLIIGGIALFFIIGGLVSGNPPSTSNPTYKRSYPRYPLNPVTSGLPPQTPPRYRPREYLLWRERVGIPRRFSHPAATELRRRTFFTRHLQQAFRFQENWKARQQIWRRSITGLISLAQTNLQAAKRKLQLQLYDEATINAATSVENMTRALIYCYGDKPYAGSGQEEALRILASRLNSLEKNTLEKVIDHIATINHHRLALKNHATQKAKFADTTRVHQLVERASTVIEELQQIMSDRFQHEIPELPTHK